MRGSEPEDNGRIRRILIEIYDRLLEEYGPQHWWPADTRLEVIIGAILTQSTAWSNVTKAIANLKETGSLNIQVLSRMPDAELAALIRPVGYYNSKAKKLKAFISHLETRFDGRLNLLLKGEMSSLRQELISIYGIGDETADSIILYAAEKPIFVVDSYTRRLLLRMNLIHNKAKYGELQGLFMRSLPHQTTLFQEYHALIVEHCKERCLSVPVCDTCPLLGLCRYPRRGGVRECLRH